MKLIHLETGKIYKISYLDHSTGEHQGSDFEKIKLWKLIDIGKVILVKTSHIVLANSWGENENEDTITKYTCILRSAILEVMEMSEK